MLTTATLEAIFTLSSRGRCNNQIGWFQRVEIEGLALYETALPTSRPLFPNSLHSSKSSMPEVFRLAYVDLAPESLDRAIDYSQSVDAAGELSRMNYPIVRGPSRHPSGHNLVSHLHGADRLLIEFYNDMNVFLPDLYAFQPRPWHEDLVP